MISRVCLMVLALFLLAPSVQAEKVITVGIVSDGAMEQESWSPELFKSELLALTQDFNVRFPENKQLDGGWSAKRIAAAITQLQEDPEVDMVLLVGYVSSAIAVQQQPLRKPTFAPFIMDAQLLGLPDKKAGSGIPNLNYLSSGANFVRDLQVMNDVARCRNIAVFLGQADYEAQPSLINRAREVTSSAGVALQFIQLHGPHDNPARRLPDGIDCVVVSGQGALTTSAIASVIKTLIEKKIPSYSLLDARLVKQGVLMAEAPETNWQRLARRNALNMHAVMHGERAEDQVVTMKEKRRLMINMATARAIGISPRFALLNEAVLINELPLPQGRRLNLAMVAERAVEANLDLRVAALSLDVGQADVDEAEAALWPQLGARIGHQRLNNNSTAVISGVAAKQSTAGAITLNQLLFSDSANANVAIQGFLQQNRAALKQQLELDIVQEATVTYLNLLKAQTLVYVRRENMELSRTNLELARSRQQIGVASPAEAYRWESQLAASRQSLLAAKAQLSQSRDALNRLLHRPLSEPFVAEPATLDDPRLVVSRKELFNYVDNYGSYQLLGDFMVQEGIEKAPELAALDAQLSASQRELSTNRRAYWLPTVTLQGEVSNVMDEQRLAGLSNTGRTDWSVSVNLSLPLFEGGARRARVAGSSMRRLQLQTQRSAASERVEQRIRVALHNISASYPSIQLSKDAAIAAKKNLRLVIEAYSRGAVPILDLLDAQNAALVAKEAETNAVFDFLIDLMDLQRAACGFDFFLDEQGLDNWLGRLKQYIEANDESPRR